MREYIPVLKNSQLFAGVAEEEIAAMLGCLQARLRTYRRGETVLRQGDSLHSLALLAGGGLHIQRDDYWGNRSIISQLEPGEMFGEAYLAPNSGPLATDVVAVEDSAVLFLELQRVLTTCPSACRFHAMVVQNLFYAISEKNRMLVQKLGHLSRRTIREKLISYLSEEAKRSGGSTFSIPFNRQQLADFLSVDRSALSAQLCQMRDEGLLTFRKNRFTLR